MPRLCSIDGCDKNHRARGLCATHYNQQHQPNRHRKVEMPCDTCGATMLKEPGRRTRYEHLYCSDLCHAYARHGGPLTSKLPRDHWAFMIGQTCDWTPPTLFDCAWCGRECTSGSHKHTYCSTACRKRAKAMRRRGREYGAPGEYTWTQVVRLWLTFDKRCAYCREELPLDHLNAEHVAALANGGANNIGNILPSCPHCNSDKRDLTLTEWKKDRERRRLRDVVTTLDHSDARYSHLSPATHALAA